MGKGLIRGRAPSDAEWLALVARRSAAEVTAVATTGICCRAGCPARTPRRENVSLFENRAAAEAAGYRACKRCWGGAGYSRSSRPRLRTMFL